MMWKLTIAGLVVAAVAGVAYVSGVSKAGVQGAFERIKKSSEGGEGAGEAATQTAPAAPAAPWDGVVKISKAQQATIGLQTVRAKDQEQPIRLELFGTTAYDETTFVNVRSRFDTLVQKVYVNKGQPVRKGDPLLELFSVDLLKAKNDYKSAFIKWTAAKRLYDKRKDLHKTGAISDLVWIETQNDEAGKKLDLEAAEQTLLVYQMSPEEVASLVVGLDPNNPSALKDDTKILSVMTLRSPADGYIIDKTVVATQFYQDTDVLMTIAPLDHLYVWANVYESDQSKVGVGQHWEVLIPSYDLKVKGIVEYVSNRVDPDTHAVRIRATIPNPEAKLKDSMLVRAMLEIPPVPGNTEVPRISVVTANDQSYVFVEKPGTDDQFIRRKVRMAQENSDSVVIAEGISVGDVVVTTGSLIAAQLYEDLSTVATGSPL